jgi:phytoene dehydrogenase-like protein
MSGGRRNSTGTGPVAVVGAGPNGLAAAIVLAREGLEVVVHEATQRIGGGTRTAELTRPGFQHDVCSSVHPMAATSPFFRTLNLEAHGLDWVHPPRLVAHPFDDGSAVALHRSVEVTAEGLDRGDGLAYRRMMGPLVERWEETLEEAMSPPLRLPRHPMAAARLARLGLRSAAGVAASRFSSPRARSLFLGMAAHSVLPLDRVPSAAFGVVLALAGHAGGWPFARGGSQTIADALASVLGELGGSIRIASPVRSLEAVAGARAMVLDLTPRQALAVAGDALPASYRRRLERYRYGPGVFKVDWALSEPIPWRARECHDAGTVHLGGDPAEIGASLATVARDEHPDLPFVILTQPSRFDPSRAPAGRHTAWAYCHVPHGSSRDMTGAIEDQVERFAPGFREIVLDHHAMDCAALEAHDENLVGGAITGGIQDLRQLLFRPVPRLDPYATPHPRLFLCSASTPPGGGVHGMCGYHAARSVLRRLA